MRNSPFFIKVANWLCTAFWGRFSNDVYQNRSQNEMGYGKSDSDEK